MKQSLHYYIPKINEPISFAQFVKSNFEGQKFIAHCEETDKKFKNEVKNDEKVTILIESYEGFFYKRNQFGY